MRLVYRDRRYQHHRVIMAVQQRIAAGLAALAISAAGLTLVKHHEGKVLAGYKDPVGIVTACYGHTATAKLGKKYTVAECEALLKQDVAVTEAAIKRLVKVPITQDQYDALVSFVFNVGPTAFAKSTLLRKLNAGDCWGAANELPRWDKAGGKTLPGLTRRRNDERISFIKACHVPPKALHFPEPIAPAPTDLPTERRALEAAFRRRGLDWVLV